MIVYKLFNLRKDGSIGPLYINKSQRIPLNIWLQSENHKTKGYAERPGWHAVVKQEAPHMHKRNRVWGRCQVQDYKIIDRPKNQGGKWVLAKKMKVLELLNAR